MRAPVALLALGLLAGGGCAPAAPAAPALAGRAAPATLLRSELLFGRLRPGGALVTDAEWQRFVAEQVTPRFPAGFTVLDATGQYRDRSGAVVSEPTKILLIVHPADARAAIDELREAYRRLFDQESVLVITAPADARF